MTLAREIHNPVTGDAIAFLASPLSGDGDLLRFRCTLPPHGAGAPLHLHDTMTEAFTVETGVLEIDLGGGVTCLLTAGEGIVIGPGTPHGFRNPGDAPVTFLTTANPGEGLETFLRGMYALAAAGKTNTAGMPRDPRVLGELLYSGNLVMPGIPRLIQRALLAVLRFAASLTGADRRLQRMVRASCAGPIRSGAPGWALPPSSSRYRSTFLTRCWRRSSITPRSCANQRPKCCRALRQAAPGCCSHGTPSRSPR
jgi:mannose-6-phosphate isomerase-like protein (cupin superfamily)